MDEKIKDIKINSDTVKDMTIGKAFGTKENKSAVDSTVNDIIIRNAQNSNSVKSVIDLAATSKALENEKTVDKIVDENGDLFKQLIQKPADVIYSGGEVIDVGYLKNGTPIYNNGYTYEETDMPIIEENNEFIEGEL